LFYNESHKWYFVDGQNVDEVWLFKCADNSQDSSVAKSTLLHPSLMGTELIEGVVAHTSFNYSETPKDSRPRESIEVRVLVFYND